MDVRTNPYTGHITVRIDHDSWSKYYTFAPEDWSALREHFRTPGKLLDILTETGD